MKVNLDADIVPGGSLGGITIGSNFDQIIGAIEFDVFNDRFEGEIIYQLLKYPIRIGVDIDTREIFKVGAYAGYNGFLFERYRPGMAITAVLADPDWRFSDWDGAMLSSTSKGVAINTALIDPEYDQILNENIHSIDVFDANSDIVPVS